MKNKKGFTLLEFLLVMVVMLIVIVVSLPLILYAIKQARLSAFKTSAQNVLDSVQFHFANTPYMSIPEGGIDINELDVDLKNNNFDQGVIQKVGDDLQLVYLIKNNYCAMGTAKNLRVTDSGCGALDTTAPEQVYIYWKETTKDSLTVIASAKENESEIISYEYSIDGQKYEPKTEENVHTFSNLKSGSHKVKVRVTNEAKLTKESEEYVFDNKEKSTIQCYSKGEKTGFKSKETMICEYPNSSEFEYQYSEDATTWNDIQLVDGKYEFQFDQNKRIYTRVLENGQLKTITTIQINNIDTTLNGAYPELLSNMIPIIYSEEKKSWVKADSRILYFNYQNKQWANAVMVHKRADSDDPNSHDRDYYLSDDAIGNPIYEGDILGYYVWIPRYRYQLFNVSNKKIDPLEISIQFEGKDIKKSNGKKNDTDTNGEYLTHPAFTVNGKEYNGFWVSKFQNSVGKTSNCYLSKDVTNCNVGSNYLYSLPNSDSVTNVSYSNAYLMSNDMTKSGNIYGLMKASTHVITNLEWGAIAYLTNSSYGDSNINSTTGNVTGVYQMASSLKEMVMANYNQDAGKNKEDNSGFQDYGTVSWPNVIDYYNGITSKNRILGDATGETEGWYQSEHNFVNGEEPFMVRGGTMNQITSIYNFDHNTGNYHEDVTFRTCILSEN